MNLSRRRGHRCTEVLTGTNAKRGRCSAFISKDIQDSATFTCLQNSRVIRYEKTSRSWRAKCVRGRASSTWKRCLQRETKRERIRPGERRRSVSGFDPGNGEEA